MSYIQLKTQIDHANREAETDCIAFMLPWAAYPSHTGRSHEHIAGSVVPCTGQGKAGQGRHHRYLKAAGDGFFSMMKGGPVSFPPSFQQALSRAPGRQVQLGLHLHCCCTAALGCIPNTQKES